jgi:hypothetical protein
MEVLERPAVLRRQMLYPAELRARSGSESDSKAFDAEARIEFFCWGAAFLYAVKPGFPFLCILNRKSNFDAPAKMKSAV